MSSLRWLDKTQPQTLMSATILLYIDAVFGIIYGLEFILHGLGLLLVLGQAVAGVGIANEKKWAYWLAVALVPIWLAAILFNFIPLGVINFIFYAALMGLLLHPQSRNYRRVWFR